MINLKIKASIVLIIIFFQAIIVLQLIPIIEKLKQRQADIINHYQSLMEY